MTRQDIIDAYVRIRTIDMTIPDDVLDFMKDSALKALETQQRATSTLGKTTHLVQGEDFAYLKEL